MPVVPVHEGEALGIAVKSSFDRCSGHETFTAGQMEPGQAKTSNRSPESHGRPIDGSCLCTRQRPVRPRVVM